jgi:ABC-2 type transport system ATP-binding protein
MLELRQISKSFGKNVLAVDNISLTFKHGVLGLIGHNGAGKTTLMQMIATLQRPSSGQLLFQGTDIVKTPDAMRARLGFLPQDFGVFANLSALEFMRYFAALKGVRSPARIRELLELVNLHEQMHRQADTFSGGMRRRLGIAQALLNDPDILVVDEPTAGLDPEERLRFRNLLAELAQRKLVLISTHIVSDVETIADQLAVMRSGKLVLVDHPQAIIASAQGQIWTAQLSSTEFEARRSSLKILQAQRHAHGVNVRIVYATSPCDGAQVVEPTLEEALMTQLNSDHKLDGGG